MRKPKTRQPKAYDSLPPSPPQARQRLDVHQAITDTIVAAIEAGTAKFEMPWHRPGVAFTLPVNAATHQPYRGSNVLALWIEADRKQFEHQIFATYRQWQELGAQVRGGETGGLIVKYGEWVPKDRHSSGKGDTRRDEGDDADAGKRLYAKPAFVFNIDQVDAPAELRARLLPAAPTRRDLTERLDAVDRFVAAVGIEIRHGGQRAFYRHKDLKGEGDFIQMPPRELFTGTATSCGTHASGMTPTEAYYATLLHEEIHGSGAAHRLNRKFGERFGDKAYAFEELVAELGAAFLCAHLEVTNAPRPDHAQYCASWIEVLQGDARAIFHAASLASRAVDYLFGLQPAPAPAPAPPQRPAAPSAGSAAAASDRRGGPR